MVFAKEGKERLERLLVAAGQREAVLDRDGWEGRSALVVERLPGVHQFSVCFT